MARVIKGRVSVKKDGLEARLLWEPDVGGADWNLEALSGLLAQSGVRIAVEDRVLNDVLESFAKSKVAMESEVIARGEKPKAPIAREVDPQPLSLPPDIEAIKDEFLRQAPDPSVPDGYNISLRKTGWAEPGDSLGIVKPSEPGQQGLGLDKMPIPAPEQTKRDFHLGQNLAIAVDELHSTTTGLMRIGDGWADVVPCPRPQWSVFGGPDEGGCFLKFTPGYPLLMPPSAGDVLTGAVKLGYGHDDLIEPERLQSILAEAHQEFLTLDAVLISRSSDSVIRVDIDPLRTKAELVLRKGTGDGEPLVLKDVGTAIRKSEIKGLDGDRVKAEIMAFHRSDELEIRILLKEGKAPERGPDRKLSYSVGFLDEELTAAIRERLVFNPNLARGIMSLKSFPADSITQLALVTQGQTLFTLSEAKIGDSGKDLDGQILPGYPGNDPDLKVYEGLSWDGDKGIAKDSGILDIGDNEKGAIHLRIRAHKDAEAHITIPDDAMRAFLSLRPPIGSGAPIDEEGVRLKAEASGVTRGFLDDAISEAVQLAATGEIVSGLVIAEGRVPMDGNTKLRLLVTGDPSKKPIPVKAGDAIGEILQEEDGGWDVRGHTIAGGEGISTGDNIDRREDEGKTLLIAARSGHLLMDGTNLIVKDKVTISGDVSLATGNVRFPGRIQVTGSVLSRVVVEAGDGIDVGEVVQAALLTSGGDIVIARGVKGEGKAVLRAQGNISLSYAEDANILVTGNLKAGKALMNCRIKCNGSLSLPSSGGKVIGGILKLKDGMDVGDVGNERETETVISFGQDYLVENQIDQVQVEIQKIQDYINRTDQLMTDLERKRATQGLITIRKKKVDALKLLNKKNLRLFLLREKFERHFVSEVKVRGTVWPGVTFESHGRVLQVRDPLRNISITFDGEKGRLIQRSL